MQKSEHKLNRLKLAQDPAVLRDEPLYQQMRTEINRLGNPLRGGTNWEKVYSLALEVASTIGADLLTAGYYISAASKTQGVSGLASGLELMLSTVSYCDMKDVPEKKIIEIINWSVSKVTPDLKKMEATLANMRDWYRCEHACQQLFELLKERHPQQVPNLDVLGYVIFEKLDHIERLQRKPNTQVPFIKNELKKRKRAKPLFIVFFSLFLLTFCIGNIYLGVTYQNKLRQQFPMWFTSIPVAVKHASVSQWIDELFDSLAPQALDTIEPEQVSYLVKLDKDYRKFSTTRSKLSNFSLLTEQLPKNTKQVQSTSVEVANYSNSLSPILARTYFIETLLEEKNHIRANDELAKLDIQLKGLLIKRTLLFRQWSQLSTQRAEVTNKKEQ